MPLDQGVLDSVVNSNFKTLAEQVGVNTANHQHRLQLIAESSVGQILNRMNGLDPTEAASIRGVVGSDLSKAIAELGSTVAGLQQLMKGAQSTLPETGQG